MSGPDAGFPVPNVSGPEAGFGDVIVPTSGAVIVAGIAGTFL